MAGGRQYQSAIHHQSGGRPVAGRKQHARPGRGGPAVESATAVFSIKIAVRSRGGRGAGELEF